MTAAHVKKFRLAYNRLESLLIMSKNYKKQEMTFAEYDKLNLLVLNLLRLLTECELPYRTKKIPLDVSEFFAKDGILTKQHLLEKWKLERQELVEKGIPYHRGIINGSILDLQNEIKKSKRKTRNNSNSGNW